MIRPDTEANRLGDEESRRTSEYDVIDFVSDLTEAKDFFVDWINEVPLPVPEEGK